MSPDHEARAGSPVTENGAADRAALLAVAAQFFANGAMTASFVARAPQLRTNIGVELREYGLLLTLTAVVGILTSVLAGRIVHATTTRRVLAMGAVVMTMSLPVIGLARGPWIWVVGVSSYVLFDTLVDISMNLQGARLSARRAAPIMNRLHGLWSLGTLAGGLGAVAANARGVSPAAHLSAVAAVMAAVLFLVTRHLLPDDKEDAGPRVDAAHSSSVDQVKPSLLSLALIILSGMFAVVLEAVGGDWATFRLSDDLEASAALASAALVAYSVGMTTMRLGGDHLQLRLGRQALHRLSVALSALGFALASLVPSQLVSLVGFLLVGLGVATFMPKLYDDAARIPGRKGAGLGAMTAGMRMAHLLTPALVSALVSGGASLGAAIAVCSLPAAAGLILVSEWSARSSHQGAT